MRSVVVALALILAAGTSAPSLVRADESELQQLRKKVETLTQENESLRRRVAQFQADLDKAGNGAQEMTAAPGKPPAAAWMKAWQLAPWPPANGAGANDLLPWELGVRSGWADSPWHAGTGGAFLGTYLDRQISDSLLDGNVNLEFMIGTSFGAHAGGEAGGGGGGGGGKGGGGGGATRQPQHRGEWQDSYFFEPTLQYYPHLGRPLTRWPTRLWPYVLAGPEAVLGRFANPPHGNSTHAEASVVVGAGLKMLPFWQGGTESESVSFGERLACGMEWRFNQGTNGLSFNQYMATLSVGF